MDEGLRAALVPRRLPAVRTRLHCPACLELGVPAGRHRPAPPWPRLVVSGCPSRRLEGFLPRRHGRRDRRLTRMATEPRTMVVLRGPAPGMAPDAIRGGLGPSGGGRRPRAHNCEQVCAAPGEVRDQLADQGPRGELTWSLAGVPAGGATRARPADLPQRRPLAEGGPDTRGSVTGRGRGHRQTRRGYNGVSGRASTDDPAAGNLALNPGKAATVKGDTSTSHPILHQRPSAQRPLHHHAAECCELASSRGRVRS